MVHFVNRAFEWGVAIATFLSVFSVNCPTANYPYRSAQEAFPVTIEGGLGTCSSEEPWPWL